jgi:heme exporter protein C
VYRLQNNQFLPTMTQAESYRSTRIKAAGLSVLASGLMVWALYLIFFWVPTERVQGVVQRIFYIHVPSAWVSFIAFGIVAVCSLGYLWLQDQRLDDIAVSAGELGLLFISGALVTGSLWGRIAWGTWWQWEARLTLTLLLWLIFIAYFAVRSGAENPEKGKRFGAILGLIGALNIPLVHMSVYWFRSLHPQPVILNPEGPTADTEMWQTIAVSFAALLVTFFALLLYRYVLARMKGQIDVLRFHGAAAPASSAEGTTR